MGKIKSFVYLNESKMYSLSSQLFEGLTEYILSEKKDLYPKVTCRRGLF